MALLLGQKAPFFPCRCWGLSTQVINLFTSTSTGFLAPETKRKWRAPFFGERILEYTRFSRIGSFGMATRRLRKPAPKRDRNRARRGLGLLPERTAFFEPCRHKRCPGLLDVIDSRKYGSGKAAGSSVETPTRARCPCRLRGRSLARPELAHSMFVPDAPLIAR